MTIEELLEIEEIRTLRSKWGHFYDGGDIPNLVDLFTDDAVLEFSERYGGHWVGKENIRANYTKYAPPDKPAYGSLHAGTNSWITLTGPDEAKGRWYLLDFNTRPGIENPLAIFGVYDDDYRKVDGVWKIARARLHFLWPNRETGDL